MSNTGDGISSQASGSQPDFNASTNLKHQGQFKETVDDANLERAGTYYDDSRLHHLSQEHKDYLMERHGTLDLDPLPGFGSADPLNWPAWQKTTNLILVAFHAFMSTFTAASIIPAYEDIAAEFGVTVAQASYLTGIVIAVLGGAPLFWRPISVRWGRRNIWFISTLGSLILNIGCAKSPSYGSMMACRALVAWFISPAAAIGSGVVTETFFKKERARYMGIWTLMVTCGVPFGSFIFGFVAQHVSWRWIYWVLAIVNGIQFLLYIPFGPETRYLRRGVEHEGSDFKQQFMTFKRLDPTPLQFYDFVHPLTLFSKPSAILPALSYSVIFLFGSVLITVEIPQLFGATFGFGPQTLSLQFIGIIIGSIIGEQLGGVLSDIWMRRRAKAAGKEPAPEYRLWLSYLGFICTIVGLVVFFVELEKAGTHWNVIPIIGTGIAAAGNQIVTTVMITYAVDCLPSEAASVGVFITFVRQMLGFIGPFWFPYMFDSVGLDGSAGIGAALMIVFSVIPALALQWKGQNWRESKEAHPPFELGSR